MKSKLWVLLEIVLVVCGIVAFCYLFVLWAGVETPEAQTSLDGKNFKKQTTFFGYASWYGKRFHGLRTKNGERFNMNSYTAAHKTLPFNTWVRVTNLSNRKTVVVRINDRGPHITDRVIDLSYQAAQELEFTEDGVEEVKVEVLDGPPAPPVETPKEAPAHAPSAQHPTGVNMKEV